MNRRTIILIWSLGLIFSRALPAAVYSTIAPISQYMVSNEQLMLRHANGEYSISIPISDRVKPVSATLDLVVTNSNLLKSNRSQVSVYVNDYLVGQVKLDSANNNVKAKFPIEPEYLKNGYNKVTFKAAQHYTDSHCEDESAPELWTNIDTVKSTFTLNYEAVDVAEKLSALDELINDRLGRYPLSILRGDSAVSDHYLAWGALISQGVKLRLKYVPLQLEEKPVTVSGDNTGRFAIDPNVLTNDAVLVGTKAQIAKLIPVSVGNAIQGPYLGIFRQDSDKTHFILVVSGNNDEQVSIAARALALLNARFPDQKQSVIQAVPLDKEPNLLSPGSIVPGNSYKFSQFDYENNLQDGGIAKLDLRLPADIYSTEEKMVALNLELAYGAAMRNDSVINIDLNGVFIHAIHLKESGGAHYQDYHIHLPLRNFRAGPNTLTFKAVLTPSESGECLYVQRKNLVATIYPDSTISFPDAGHVAELPDLQLFARTGFPLAQNGSAGQTVFKLLDTSSDSIASAWHLIAMLAAQQQVPLFDLNITQGDIPAADNVVLIGKVGVIGQAGAVMEGAPVKLGQDSRFPYTFKEQQTSAGLSTWDWLDDVLFGSNSKPNSVDISRSNVSVSQSGGLGDEFLLMSYPNPEGKGVVLALLSEKDNSLNQGLNQLESSALWSRLRGNVFVWDKLERFSWQQQGNTITLGDGNLRLTFIMHFSEHPWQWLLIVALFLLAIAWMTHMLLSKFKRTHHNG